MNYIASVPGGKQGPQSRSKTNPKNKMETQRLNAGLLASKQALKLNRTDVLLVNDQTKINF